MNHKMLRPFIVKVSVLGYFPLYTLLFIYSINRLYRHPRISENMSVHPYFVTYDKSVTNLKLRPLNRIYIYIIKYQIYTILDCDYIVNYVY